MKEANTIEAIPETKKKLLDASAKLMRAHGFSATTVDQICAEAGVTKGGFFHYFKTKEEIAKFAILHFAKGKSEAYLNAPHRSVTDPLERILTRLDYVSHSYQHQKGVLGGCLIGMIAQEISFSHPDLRQACQAAFAFLHQDFQNDLIEAKAKYAPDSEIDPSSIATFYTSIIQGSLMMAKVTEKNSVMVTNLNEFRRYIEYLFKSARPVPAKAASAKATR